LFLDDFDGEIVTNFQKEIIEIIKKRPAFNSNHFIFTFAENGFPQLTAFVKNDYCIIYYLDKNITLVSKGNNKGLETFYENKNGATLELAKENIISVEYLKECVLEYFATNECPKCIEWRKI
jgi:hypothetical protein